MASQHKIADAPKKKVISKAEQLFDAVKNKNIPKIIVLINEARKSGINLWESYFTSKCHSECGCSSKVEPITALFSGPENCDDEATLDLARELFRLKLITADEIADESIYSYFANHCGWAHNHERANFLLDVIPQERLVTVHNEYGRNLIHALIYSHCDEKQKEELFDKLVEKKVDVARESKFGGFVEYLICTASINLLKKVKTILGDKFDCNKYYKDDDQVEHYPSLSHCFMKQKMCKDVKFLNDIKDTVIFLIANEYNFKQIDHRGYNVYDYMYTYGWQDLATSLVISLEKSQLIPEEKKKYEDTESFEDESTPEVKELKRYLLTTLKPLSLCKDMKIINEKTVEFIKLLSIYSDNFLYKIRNEIRSNFSSAYGFLRLDLVTQFFEDADKRFRKTLDEEDEEERLEEESKL